jgi:hypothetical protein
MKGMKENSSIQDGRGREREEEERTKVEGSNYIKVLSNVILQYIYNSAQSSLLRTPDPGPTSLKFSQQHLKRFIQAAIQLQKVHKSAEMIDAPETFSLSLRLSATKPRQTKGTRAERLLRIFIQYCFRLGCLTLPIAKHKMLKLEENVEMS